MNTLKLHKQHPWWLLYSIPALLIMCAVYIFVHKIGRTAFMGFDGYAMQYSTTLYIKTFWTELFAGRLPEIDMTLGEGLNPILQLAYYGLLDPLNLMFVVVPENAFFEAYTINMVLRWWLSGLCAGFAMKQYSDNQHTIAAGALTYTFAGYLVMWQFCPSVLAAGYLFPMLVLAIQRALRQRKYGMLVLSTTLAYLTNYYIAIIMSILLFIYACLYIANSIIQTKKITKTDILTYTHTVMAHATGILMSAWTFIPMCIYFLSGVRTDSNISMSPWVYDWHYYLDALAGLFSPCKGASSWFENATQLPSSINPLVLPGILMLLASFKHSKRNVITWGIVAACICGICFPWCNSLVSLTGYPIQRWTFALALVMSATMVQMMPTMHDMPVKTKVLSCSILMICAVIAYWTMHLAAFIINLVLTLIAISAIWRPSIKGWYRATCLIMALLIVGWYFGSENLSNYMFRTVTDAPECNVLNDCAGYLQDVHLNNRISFMADELSVNQGFVTHQYTTQGSLNSMPNSVMKYNSTTQAYPSIMSSYWRINDDGRTGTAMMAGVKYYITAKEYSNNVPYGFEAIGETKYHVVHQTNHQTSLGYVLPNTLSTNLFSQLNIAQKQVALTKYAVIDNGSDNWTLPDYELSYTVTENNGLLQYNVMVPQNSELYIAGTVTALCNTSALKLHTPDWHTRDAFEAREQAKYINITALDNTDSVQNKFLGRHPDMYPSYYQPYRTACLGHQLRGNVTITLQYSHDLLTVDNVAIYAVPIDAYQKAANDLQANLLQNVSHTHNSVTGEIAATHSGVMQVAIPYQNGWHAYVDGKEVDVFASGVKYIGFYITKGQHEIMLRYETPGMRIGCYASVVSMIIFVVTTVTCRKRRSSYCVQPSLSLS